MRCETCQGSGRLYMLCGGVVNWAVPYGCHDCGGTGWSHCCEGERPDLVPEEKGLFARKRKRLAKYEGE